MENAPLQPTGTWRSNAAPREGQVAAGVVCVGGRSREYKQEAWVQIPAWSLPHRAPARPWATSLSSLSPCLHAEMTQSLPSAGGGRCEPVTPVPRPGSVNTVRRQLFCETNLLRWGADPAGRGFRRGRPCSERPRPAWGPSSKVAPRSRDQGLGARTRGAGTSTVLGWVGRFSHRRELRT